ncbi:glucokinase [Stutzerimonas stutzeri TS44]|nr:glucokinase [Stutzerimonas stutzeri TS44]
MRIALVGDIGGTNARFALWRDQHIEQIRVLPTAAYTRPELAIRAYLAEIDQPLEALQTVCLACAGPVDGDAFRFTNNHWQLSRAAFCAELGLSQLLLINDFTAQALGMTRLREGERICVCDGESAPGRVRLVIGPGTGLGVAGLLPMPGGGWRALPGEGGHIGLPVGNEREAAIWRHLHGQFGHVDAEMVLSGPGLLTLYRACSALDGRAVTVDSPAAVTAAALTGEAYAVEVLQLFCRWFGRLVGDNVLTLGARGGVYLVGGVLPHFVEFFLASEFRHSLCDKGQMSGYFDGLPVWLVTAPYPGLEGAGVAVQPLLESA